MIKRYWRLYLCCFRGSAAHTGQCTDVWNHLACSTFPKHGQSVTFAATVKQRSSTKSSCHLFWIQYFWKCLLFMVFRFILMCLLVLILFISFFLLFVHSVLLFSTALLFSVVNFFPYFLFSSRMYCVNLIIAFFGPLVREWKQKLWWSQCLLPRRSQAYWQFQPECFPEESRSKRIYRHSSSKKLSNQPLVVAKAMFLAVRTAVKKWETENFCLKKKTPEFFTLSNIGFKNARYFEKIWVCFLEAIAPWHQSNCLEIRNSRILVHLS